MNSLPEGAVLRGKSPIFTRETLPDALCSQHALGPKRWGALHILEGSVTFVDLVRGVEHELSAPKVWVIRPESPHKLSLHEGPLRCRLEFFQEKDDP